jgi:glycine/serine hydroxymethyltransferase
MVVLCGADKTLCGPVCGLVMTNNEEIGNMFDETINPNYI